MQPNAEVGRMIAAGQTEADFAASGTARELAETAPDNLASLKSFFTRQPLNVTAALLTRISADGPGVTEADLAALTVPTLILGTAEDAIHPLAHAQTLARLIPHAELTELPPKGRDKAVHIAACQTAILNFLKGLPHAPPAS
jgi:pimeloyl-ACP methyl ester carboxylesterase